MTNDELEWRLRAWYRAEIGEREPAPPALYASLAAIPETMGAPVGAFGGRRGFLILTAAPAAQSSTSTETKAVR